jgi:putative FmdB family regulatory protein
LPLYEYQCAKCGELTEKRHGFDDVNTAACEHCGGELKKTFNVAGIVFKGSGFYVTDSRSSSNAAAKNPASTPESKSESKSESGSSESKSDTPKSDPPKSDPPKGDSKKEAAA